MIKQNRNQYHHTSISSFYANTRPRASHQCNIFTIYTRKTTDKTIPKSKEIYPLWKSKECRPQTPRTKNGRNLVFSYQQTVSSLCTIWRGDTLSFLYWWSFGVGPHGSTRGILQDICNSKREGILSEKFYKISLYVRISICWNLLKKSQSTFHVCLRSSICWENTSISSNGFGFFEPQKEYGLFSRNLEKWIW